jgi:hypothetical protein
MGIDLQNIPNQPIRFLVSVGHSFSLSLSRSLACIRCSFDRHLVQADPTAKQRYEDAIIAWTWKTFIENTTDPYILLRMPMTKVESIAVDRNRNSIDSSSLLRRLCVPWMLHNNLPINLAFPLRKHSWLQALRKYDTLLLFLDVVHLVCVVRCS